MKKIITLLLAAALVGASFYGCDDGKYPAPGTTAPVTTEIVTEEPPYEPADAAELWGKIDETMDSLMSFRREVLVTGTMYYSGVKATAESKGEEIFDGENFYMESSTDVVVDESTTVTTKSLIAYYDGKMYVLNEGEGLSQKLCAPTAAEDFLGYFEDNSIETDDLGECTKSEFTGSADEGWTVKMSGYTKATVNKIAKTAGMEKDSFGAEVLDLQLTAEADADFRVKTMELKFIFDDSDPTVEPSFIMKEGYSLYGEAVIDTAKFASGDFTEVDDVLILETLEDGIAQMQDAVTGAFEYSTKTVSTIYGNDTLDEEHGNVVYGRKNGGYYYDLESDYNGRNLKVSYSQLVINTTVDGETVPRKSTDEEAKATIDALIDCASYDKNTIKDIEKLEDGVYKLTVDGINILEDAFYWMEYGISPTEYKQEIFVTIDGDEIKKISTICTTIGTYNYEGQTTDVTIVSESSMTVTADIGSGEII